MNPAVHPRRLVLAFAATLLSLAAALALAPRSEAAFVTPQCQGDAVIGRGASFARDAHTVWRFNFQNFFCSSAGTFPNVTYEALGSGAGRRVVGERTAPNADGSLSRNQPPRFGMTDEPPTPTAIGQMNQGTNAVGDEGQIHVVPAAVGSVAALVNFPDNCDVNLLAANDKTDEQNLDGDGVPDDVVRVRFTKAKFEAAWFKQSDSDNWIELFPELAPDADCNKPIIRVVRFDDSGTSFAFKDYMDRLNGSRSWIPEFTTGPDTRVWPQATLGARTDCGGATGPGSQDDAIDQLTSGCANGNGPLVSKLIATDGSIGYADVSTARTATPSLAVTPEANDNDTYWTQIQNGSNAFTEPTADPNGFRTDGLRGANCQNTTFTGVPASTFGDWTPVSGVNSPQGYGICTPTYGLVFDDHAAAYGNTPAEETKARTVKDYWSSIVADSGQGVLFSNDYAPLPPAMLAIARAGVASVDWNKAGSGGPPGGGGTPPGGGGTPPGGGGPPVGAPPPSNVFSVPAVRINTRNGQATFSVRVPGAGTIEVVGRANLPRARASVVRRIGRVRLTVSQAGTYRATLRPNAGAMRVLRRKRRLRVQVTITYTPQGGTARSSTRTVTLKLRKRNRR